MNHPIETENYLDSNPELYGKIKDLVKVSIENKILKFDSSFTNIDFEYLSKKGILEKKEQHFEVHSYNVFSLIFYRENEILSNLKSPYDFRIIAEKLKSVCVDFQSKTSYKEYSLFEKTIWSQAIYSYFQSNESGFVDYLELLNPNDEEINPFIDGYSAVLSFLDVEVSMFYHDAVKLISLLDMETGLNYTYNSLYEAIVKKVKFSLSFGLESYSFILKQEKIESYVLAPVVQGLYQNHKQEIKSTLEKALDNDKFEVGLIIGLARVKSIGNEDALFYLDIFDKFREQSEILLNTCELLFAILQSKKLSNTKFIEASFIRLQNLTALENPPLINFILKRLVFSEDYENQKMEWIKGVIVQTHFDKKNLKWINHFLSKIGGIEPLSDILDCLGTNFKFRPISSELQSSLAKLSESNKIDLDKKIVDLLISDKASFRFIGNDLYNHLTQIEFQFDFDILCLNPIDQYKLWVSIFQQVRDPKDTLPPMLPLLDSPSALVKESFICKIEELAINYGGGVIKLLDNYLDSKNENYRKVKERVEKTRIEHLEKYIKVKQGIKELNPYYSKNALFQDFNNNHGRMFSRQLQKSTKENSSLLSLFKTVRLLKGGGWKTESNSDVSKLGKVSSSISLPRNYFIEPEEMDLEMGIELGKDWDEEEFMVIERLLENEQ